jgi:hypothetical protein
VRVRRIARFQLHFDLTIPAQFAGAVIRADMAIAA